MTYLTALVTDSTCDIPAEWIQQYEILVVPLTIIFGDQQFLDGVEMTPEQFYERLPRDKNHPTTSQPSPQAFLDAYRQAAEKGAQEIVVVTISSAMSGTIQSARQAAKGFEVPVHIHDGRSNSMGIGWQVIAAARAREAGGDTAAMLAAAVQVRENVTYYVSLDTIEFLAKGGRISEAAHFLNSLLKIKPLIYVKNSTGTVSPSMPARSRKQALENLYREFFKHVGSGPLHITILHNNALEEAQALAERVQREHTPVEMFISIVSPVLGTHTGPRAVALCGYAEK
jgi:DegV family protein with EDD domain